MSRDPRIDAYIAAAQPFARPILEHLRSAIHAACPGAGETVKWGRPSFEHKGRLFASLAAFKAHASLVLWRMDQAGEDTGGNNAGMGQFGQLTSIADLPAPAELDRLIRAATEVIDNGPAKKVRAAPRPPLPVPAELAEALAGSPSAQAVFDAFPPSHRNEYCEWIGEAKRPETRAKRVAQAITWISEGKGRNWQYQRDDRSIGGTRWLVS